MYDNHLCPLLAIATSRSLSSILLLLDHKSKKWLVPATSTTCTSSLRKGGLLCSKYRSKKALPSIAMTCRSRLHTEIWCAKQTSELIARLGNSANQRAFNSRTCQAVERRACYELIRELCRQTKGFHSNVARYVYDGRATLYTPQPLKQTANSPKVSIST